jgi:GNAT superfamily N-acetyltransferase
VALWTPPQYRHGVGVWRHIRAGFLATPFSVGLEMPLRRLSAVRDIERRHRAEVKEPHWSLELIGVDPGRQRTGAGGALIRHVLDQADEQGLPAYVITHDERNVAYYERFGFRLVGKAPFEPGAPPTCSLLRPTSP